MNKLFLFALVFSFLAFGQTEVSGIINSDQTWDVSNSPYIITSNIKVEAGSTLTINPDVSVKFDGYYIVHSYL